MRHRPPVPAPGIPARHATACPRCDEGIEVDDPIVYQRGRPIHVACASGSNDG